MRLLSIFLAFAFVLAIGTHPAVGDSHSNERTISRNLAENHPANWVDEDMHGEYVEKYGSSKCKACHGRNLQGNQDVPSCKGCHAKHDD